MPTQLLLQPIPQYPKNRGLDRGLDSQLRDAERTDKGSIDEEALPAATDASGIHVNTRSQCILDPEFMPNPQVHSHDNGHIAKQAMKKMYRSYSLLPIPNTLTACSPDSNSMTQAFKTTNNNVARRSFSCSSALPNTNLHDQSPIMPYSKNEFQVSVSPLQPQIPTRIPNMFPNQTFLDFLALSHGQFGGEELWDEDEYEQILDPKFKCLPRVAHNTLHNCPESMDRTKTLPDCHCKTWNSNLCDGDGLSIESNQCAESIKNKGAVSCEKALLLLIKSFIGSGVLFLPAAFKNGGLSFSFVFLIIIAWLSTRGMLLLAKINQKVPGSFGDIAGVLFGPYLRYLVLASIVLSQMGFASAYTLFICNNLLDLMKEMGFVSEWVFGPYGVAGLIGIQMLFYVPMALVRKIKAFAGFSLLGDVFILGGLTVVSTYAFQQIAAQGGIAPEIRQFNSESFALYIGTAVYTYEGIGLVGPIAKSMRNPKNFGRVLTIAIVLTTTLYLFVASLGYLAWGENVQTIVLFNLPTSYISQSVAIFYIIAIAFTWPLAMFPAIRIMEQGLLPHASGKYSIQQKWQKNCLRIGMVLVVAVVALLGAESLDRLVALVGSFACLPLSFIYPCMLHLKAFPDSDFASKCMDWSMIIFGAITMVYVTTVTVI